MTGVAFSFRNRRQITATRAWAKSLGVFQKEVQMAMPLAVREGLFPIWEVSQMLVPVDTGDLKASGFIDIHVSPKARSIKGTVGYGKNGFPFYTLIVHENLEFAHESPTRAKFLEEAFNREADNVFDNMRRFLKSFLAL